MLHFPKFWTLPPAEKGWQRTARRRAPELINVSRPRTHVFRADGLRFQFWLFLPVVCDVSIAVSELQFAVGHGGQAGDPSRVVGMI